MWGFDSFDWRFHVGLREIIMGNRFPQSCELVYIKLLWGCRWQTVQFKVPDIMCVHLWCQGSSLFSSGACRGLTARGWVSVWSTPPSACTPSPETSALTHRNTCTSWSTAKSGVRVTQSVKFVLKAQSIVFTVGKLEKSKICHLPLKGPSPKHLLILFFGAKNICMKWNI